jgi:hypothetical protein
VAVLLNNLNNHIKDEAAQILHEDGLLGILNSFGKPHITGSYSLDLMTWRDLDIYLEVQTIEEASHFRLGEMIAARFQPVKMSYRNELLGKTKGLPSGLYWGVYLGNERAGAWKIDIWVVNGEECQRLLKYCSDIQDQLTDEFRKTIMEIKSQCWQDPNYRKAFSSSDIYDAVLKHRITGITDFKKYLSSKNKIL